LDLGDPDLRSEVGLGDGEAKQKAFLRTADCLAALALSGRKRNPRWQPISGDVATSVPLPEGCGPE